MIELLTWLRYANIVMAVFCVVVVSVQLGRVYRKLATDVRLRWSAMIIFAFAAGEGTIEQMVFGIAPGFRTVLTAVALFWTCWACLLPVKYRQIDTRRRSKRR